MSDLERKEVKNLKLLTNFNLCRIYGDEEQAPLMRHSGKGVNQPRVSL